MAEEEKDETIKVNVTIIKKFFDRWKIIFYFVGGAITVTYTCFKWYQAAEDVVNATKEIPELKEDITTLYSLLEKYHIADSTDTFWANDRIDDQSRRIEQDSNIYILKVRH